MNKFLFISFLTIIVSCSSTKGVKELKKELVRGEEHFTYVDKNGEFVVKMASGFNKKKNTYITKRELLTIGNEKDKILEQSVVLSDLGSIKKKKNILRPKMSQYNVWFDGKKYFSELKLNSAKKSIDLKMVSPESQWNGTKQFKLPNTKALYCFFSQVIECAQTIGFLSEAIKKQTGSMSFYVIWQGYPYLNETYSDFPSELFSKAKLSYDGKLKSDDRRFNLTVAGQSIFFIVDKNQKMKKMLWVSQGITMVSKLDLDAKSMEVSGDAMTEAGGSIE